jgi:uncharacterized FAD-dependent dehydrogenase
MPTLITIAVFGITFGIAYYQFHYGTFTRKGRADYRARRMVTYQRLAAHESFNGALDARHDRFTRNMRSQRRRVSTCADCSGLMYAAGMGSCGQFRCSTLEAACPEALHYVSPDMKSCKGFRFAPTV